MLLYSVQPNIKDLHLDVLNLLYMKPKQWFESGRSITQGSRHDRDTSIITGHLFAFRAVVSTIRYVMDKYYCQRHLT